MHSAATSLVKRRLATISISLAISATGCLAQWNDVSSDEGAFVVRMPINVQQQPVHVTGTPFGPLAARSWTASESEGAIWNVYSISYIDLPESVAGRAETLRSMGEWRVKGWGGRIEASRPIRLDKWPGAEFVVPLEEDRSVLWCRVFLVERRFFELAASGTKSNAESERRARRFLESFALTTRP